MKVALHHRLIIIVRSGRQLFPRTLVCLLYLYASIQYTCRPHFDFDFQAMGSPKNRFQISVPNLPSNLTSDRYKKFSASFSLRSSQQPAISQEYTYESMRVRFDTPDPYVVTWKREVKVSKQQNVYLKLLTVPQAIKRRFIDFRRRLAEIFTRNWITSTRPRLSMVGH